MGHPDSGEDILLQSTVRPSTRVPLGDETCLEEIDKFSQRLFSIWRELVLNLDKKCVKQLNRCLFGVLRTIAHDDGEVNSTTGCVAMVGQVQDVSAVVLVSHDEPRKVCVLPSPATVTVKTDTERDIDDLFRSSQHHCPISTRVFLDFTV